MRRRHLPRLIRDERIAAPLFAIGFALVFSSPILGALAKPGTLEDWNYNLGLQWVAWHTISVFHQVPLWNPYKCGGMPLLANPQSRLLTPWFVLTLLFGPFVGVHLEVPVHIAVAWLGGYVLARVAGIRPLSAGASALVFAASSWFYLRISAGQVVATGFVYAPWVMAGAWRACARPRLFDCALGGLALALAFLEGGPYPAVLAAVTVGLVLAAEAAMRRSVWPLAVVALVTVFAAGFAAPKLIPAYLLSLQHPRPESELETDTWRMLMAAFFSREQNCFREIGNTWGFWEIGAYIGLFVVPAVLGLLSPRRATPWLFAAIVLYLLARGDALWPPLWPMLHAMPVFSSLRLPSRFLVDFVMLAGVLAGFGFEWLAANAPPFGALGAGAIAVAATVDCFAIGPQNLALMTLDPVAAVQPHPEFRQIGDSPRPDDMLTPAMENRGVVHCYEYTDWGSHVRPSDAPGYRGEQYLEGSGTVALDRWTPNALRYRVDATQPSVLVINQNYDRSWRLVHGDGNVIEFGDGLLGVRVPQGSQTIELRYRDRPFLLGVLITLLTIAAAIAIARRERACAGPSYAERGDPSI